MNPFRTIYNLARSGLKMGTQTGQQAATSPLASAITGGMGGQMLPFGTALNPELQAQHSRGTYETYRKMSSHPTLSLARAMVYGPIVAGSWAVESLDGTPEERVELVKSVVDPQRTHWVRTALRALEYGWAPAEKVWEAKDDRTVIKQLKPLLWDTTEMRFEKTGEFAGIRQNGLDLDPLYAFAWRYDEQPGYIYGRSRHENVRQIWDSWATCHAKSAVYHGKVAGVTAQIHYPPGTTRDISMAERPNYLIAQQLASDLSSGKCVLMPNLFAAASAGGEITSEIAALAGKSQWVIDFLDSGGAAHAQGFIDERRYDDSLFFRGWLVPERAGLEGQHGTLAEADSHGDVALMDAEAVHFDIVQAIQSQIIDDMLEVNYGPDARGSVFLTPAPLVDSKVGIYKQVLAAMLQNPGTLEMVLSMINAAEVLNTLDLPMDEGTHDVPDLTPEPKEPPNPEDATKGLSRLYERLRMAGKAA